jgi:hypothetical protein
MFLSATTPAVGSLYCLLRLVTQHGMLSCFQTESQGDELEFGR